MDLSDQPSEPLAAHLGRRHRAVAVFVVAGSGDAQQAAADLGRVSGIDEGIDYRVNPFGAGRIPEQPSRFAQDFDLDFELADAFVGLGQRRVLRSGVTGAFTTVDLVLADPVVQGRGADPNSVEAVVIGLPARTSATARKRNSGGYGRGMRSEPLSWR